MATSHKFVFLIFSLVLLALLVISIVASYNIWTLSLPISNTTGIAGILLPIFTAGGLQSFRSLLTSHHGSTRENKTWSIISIFVLLVIYETVIATLSLTHLAPTDNLTCALDQKWTRLFRSKDGADIRRIQDAHQCCGLHSILDRAWPFPDRNHGVNECAKAFNRTEACFGRWRKDEQIAAGLLLLVALSTFLLKLIILFLVRTRRSWFQRALWDRYSAPPEGDATNRGIEPSDENPGRDRRRIEAPYRDNSILDDRDEEPSSEAETVINTNVNAGNRQINQGPVLQPSRLIETDNAWREDVH